MPSLPDPLAAAALVAAALLAASAPELGSPSIVPFGVVIGGLIGAAIGRARGVHRDRTREIAENWAFAFGLLSVALYLVTLLTSV